MSRKEIYRRYREEGRCTNCGKVLDDDRAGKALCESCNVKKNIYCQKTKLIYEKLNLCNVCGKNWVGPDEKRCPECRARLWITSNRYKESHPEKKDAINQSQRKRRQFRIINHLCTDCGKELSDFRYVTCDRCRMKRRLNQRKCNERKMANGI